MVLSLFMSLVTVIQCQMANTNSAPGSVPQQPPHLDQTRQQGAFHGKAQVHDREHVMEHYEGVINPEEKLSDEELTFHYFKVHDYDQNDKLDGIELISALTHYHKNEGPDTPRMSDDELAGMIDTILKEDDSNNDGFIDYPEFIMSQSTVSGP